MTEITIPRAISNSRPCQQPILQASLSRCISHSSCQTRRNRRALAVGVGRNSRAQTAGSRSMKFKNHITVEAAFGQSRAVYKLPEILTNQRSRNKYGKQYQHHSDNRSVISPIAHIVAARAPASLHPNTVAFSVTAISHPAMAMAISSRTVSM